MTTPNRNGSAITPPASPADSAAQRPQDVIAVFTESFSDKAIAFFKNKKIAEPDAQDLVQDVFVSLLIQMEQGKQIDNANAYFWRCCRNALFSWRKKRNCNPIASSEEMNELPDERSLCEASDESDERISRAKAKVQQAATYIASRKHADARERCTDVLKYAIPHLSGKMTYKEISEKSEVHLDTVRRVLLELKHHFSPPRKKKAKLSLSFLPSSPPPPPPV